MGEKLRLKWNNHAITFNKMLNKIYMEDSYSDGTIFCQGNFYPVHRFVLSTCSEYFEEMFDQCNRLNNRHPFIIIKDIHPKHMEALLNYMYKGEANASQEMLPDLIKAAESLKIRGLFVPHEDHSPPKPKKCRRSSTVSPNNKKTVISESKITRSSRKSAVIKPAKEANITESSNILSLALQNADINPGELHCDQRMDVIVGESEVDEVVPAIIELEENNPSNECIKLSNDEEPTSSGVVKQQQIANEEIFYCEYKGCPYTSDKISLVRAHMRIHTGEKPFKCPECSYRSAQPGTLKLHFRSVHLKLKRFQCPHCTHKTTRKTHLKLHISRRHPTKEYVDEDS